MKRFFILLSFFTLGTVCFSCSSGQESKVVQEKINALDPIDEFWKWFAANEQRISKDRFDNEKSMGEIRKELEKIQQGIKPHMMRTMEGIKLTITAEGQQTLFPMVKKIVEKAPKINGWEFIALLQPIPNNRIQDFLVTTPGCRLRPDQVAFSVGDKKDSLDLVIYVKGLSESNNTSCIEAGRQWAIGVLGEYAFATKIRNLLCKPMPENETDLKKTKPMTELQK
ncbi:MAG: hypothetical protein IAF38_07400, partial [Bacteroidia bacterium]|nr:hypothetical protein [Bacteroidia bacterium]